MGSDIDGEAPHDQSGYAVSLSGDKSTLVVGAFKNDGNGVDSGHVRAYRFEESKGWVQIGKDIDGESEGDNFGISVATSRNGNTLAIGGIKTSDVSGHVRVYRLIDTEWVQIGKDIDGQAIGDEMGRSVAISDDGNIVAVGAPKNDSESKQDAGHVRVYQYSLTTDSFGQLGEDITGENEFDAFGYTLSLSGDGSTIAVGSSQLPSMGLVGTGKVRVFKYNAGSNQWAQVGNTLKGLNEEDQFGYSVATSKEGNTVAVGAPLSDIHGENSGSVSVFTLSGNEWLLVGNEIKGEASYDSSGVSVDISDDGRVVAIGGFLNSGQNGLDSGHVRVYELNDDQWILLGDDLDGEHSADLFGRSVSISSDGSMVAIGGHWNDGVNGINTGYAQVFTLEAATKSPSSMPSNGPSSIPSTEPTDKRNTPSNAPSSVPSTAPTNAPTAVPTLGSSNIPTNEPSSFPSKAPTSLPAVTPTTEPSYSPSNAPYSAPTFEPSGSPSNVPSSVPSTAPSNAPTDVPTLGSSSIPTNEPSSFPSKAPTSLPTATATIRPSGGPSNASSSYVPTSLPSETPSVSIIPTVVRTSLPTTSVMPSEAPSMEPSKAHSTGSPTKSNKSEIPSSNPSISIYPSGSPISSSTSAPTFQPSGNPWNDLSSDPSTAPTNQPTAVQTLQPSNIPTNEPSSFPSTTPTRFPSTTPTLESSKGPTGSPSKLSSSHPSIVLSSLPSSPPSFTTSDGPSIEPSSQPTLLSSGEPSIGKSPGPSTKMSPFPSGSPVAEPSSQPTLSSRPSGDPSGSPTWLPTVSAMPSARLTLDGWRQVGQSIDGTQMGDKSGSSIALSKDANCIAVGSPFNDESGENVGHVRVFRKSAENTWEQLGETLIGENKETRFGTSVDLSDSCETLAVGGILNANEYSIRTGHVRVFRLSGGQWIQMANDINGFNLFDNMGRSVSLSGDGNTVAVGAPRFGDDFGLVQVFRYSNYTNSFTQLGKNLTGIQTDAFFGHAISISSDGDIIAVGSFGVSSPGLSKNGRVEIFQLDDDDWIRFGQPINGTEDKDQFGVSVSLSDSGDTIAASSTYHNDDSGLVRVYRLTGGIWTQLGQDIVGTNADALSGWSTSISADGNIVAIGGLAKNEEIIARGAGHVLVFKLMDDKWVLAGDVYTGDVSTGLFGRAVSLSGDGEILAASIPTASGDGVVKVFERFNMEYPSASPTSMPFAAPPSKLSSSHPSIVLSSLPSSPPSFTTSDGPSIEPSSQPTLLSSGEPSIGKSPGPSTKMSPFPSGSPVAEPSSQPTLSSRPSGDPSGSPTWLPTVSAMPSARLTLDGWRQVGQSIDGTQMGDKSGSSIALSKDANCIAVGSPFNDESGENVGHVRVFRKSAENTWEQLGETLIGENKETRFGTSVDLSDSCETLAVGGILNANEYSIRTGHVRVFRLSGGQWIQMANDINGFNLFDNMGRSVSLSGDGNTVAVGAPRFGDDFGLVQVFRYSNYTNSFTQLGKNLTGIQTDAFFGHAISISSDGDIIAVGSFGVSSPGLSKNGRVEIFQLDDDDWIRFGQPINGTEDKDQFGVSVSLSDSGDTIAASSTYHNDDSGLVRVYRLTGGIWTQLGQDIVGTNADALSGWSTSISADGNIVAIGGLAKNEEIIARGAGHVLVFKLMDDKWVLAGDVYTGDVSTGLFGRAVSLSGDGEILAASIPTASGDGVVKVFERFNMEYPSASPTSMPFAAPFPSATLVPPVSPSMEPSRAPRTVASFDPTAVPSTASPTKFIKPSSMEPSLAPSTVASFDPTVVPSTSSPSKVIKPSSMRGPSPNPSSSMHPSGSPSTSRFPSVAPTSIKSSPPESQKPSSVSEPTIPSLRPSYSHRPSCAPVSVVKKWQVIDSFGIGDSNVDLPGWLIEMSGDGKTIAVGNSLDDNTNGNNAGSVNIFRLLEGSYQPLGNTILLSNGGVGDNFGDSVALSVDGNICIIGANNFNGIAGSNSGVAIVYRLSSDKEWIMMGNTIEGVSGGDKAGTSVDISDNGDIIAVGAYLNDNINGDSAGHVRMFEYNSNDERWYQLGKTLNGESSSDGFGASVALSSNGTTIGVGGPLSNTYYEGHARVFRLSDKNEWVQVGNNINGNVRDGNFGDQVDLSSDGNIIAIGMPGEVKIFRLENGSWTMLGGPIEGYEVSLADDGLVAAVRYPNGGVVRLLKYSNEEWVQIGDSIIGSPDSLKGGYVTISGNGYVVAAASISGSTGNVIVYENAVDGPFDVYTRSENEQTRSSSMTKPQTVPWFVGTLILAAVNFYII